MKASLAASLVLSATPCSIQSFRFPIWSSIVQQRLVSGFQQGTPFLQGIKTFVQHLSSRSWKNRTLSILIMFPQVPNPTKNNIENMKSLRFERAPRVGSTPLGSSASRLGWPPSPAPLGNKTI